MNYDGHKELIEQQFGRTATSYVTSETHAKASDLELLVQWINPRPDHIAIDVATGGGHVAKALSPHVNTVFATDLTQAMLQAARTHLDNTGARNVQYVVADAQALPFLNDSFDIVTCRIAAHHFPSPHHFVQEAYRVLKPGGQFLLIDNVAPDDVNLAQYLNTFERMRDESHVRCPSIREWETWLSEAQFRIDKSLDCKKMLKFEQWMRRMAKSEEHIQDVAGYMHSAPNSVRAYFELTEQDNVPQTFKIDEWMALAVKR